MISMVFSTAPVLRVAVIGTGRMGVRPMQAATNLGLGAARAS